MGLLDPLPLYAVFIITAALVLVAIEAGYRLGTYRRFHSEHEKEAPVGAMVGAALGLLAFMLAFTFGAAASRFDDRKQVLLEEANSIGTTYLRAGLLPEPHASEVRTLLRSYVDLRLEAARTGAIETALRSAPEIHERLWHHAVALSAENPGSIASALFIQSLNETIDVHTKRVQIGVRNRIPSTIWLALYGVAFVALGAMGYHQGLSSSSRSAATLAVTITFSMVLWLIADLDRPGEGTMMVNQQAMEDVRNSISAPVP